MFAHNSKLFEDLDNEELFKNICKKLSYKHIESIWNNNSEFSSDNTFENMYEIKELCLTELDLAKKLAMANVNGKDLNNLVFEDVKYKEGISEKENEMMNLKDNLMKNQSDQAIKHLLVVLSGISFEQVSVLCEVIHSASANEEASVLLLKAVLQLEKPLGLSVTAALIGQLIFPQMFETKKNLSRDQLTSILSFCEIYPKAIIEELLVPCLNKETLELSHAETLQKMLQSYLPAEYIPYCLQKIVDCVSPSENTFMIMQNVLERKIHLEETLLDKLSKKLQIWSQTSNKSVKYTKMIISILSLYGAELSEDQIKIYYDVILNNETIMKKAAENLLKKLRIKQ